MYSKEEHDKTVNGLLESAEIAKRKLLEYLQEKSLEEIEIEIDDMEEGDLESLNEWALKGEIYVVCQAIKKVLASK